MISFSECGKLEAFYPLNKTHTHAHEHKEIAK